MKMTKKQEAWLRCICGACTHKTWSKTCVFNKIINAKDPAAEQMKQIKMLMRDVLKTNTPKTDKKKAKK